MKNKPCNYLLQIKDRFGRWIELPGLSYQDKREFKLNGSNYRFVYVEEEEKKDE